MRGPMPAAPNTTTLLHQYYRTVRLRSTDKQGTTQSMRIHVPLAVAVLPGDSDAQR